MESSPSPTQPSWLYKRDGRLVPFEADKISRSLFAATESLGQPNAFLARELTDGVLHFLRADFGSETPTTEQVADLVIKVVRELGQPALAQAYAEHSARKAEREPAAAPTLLQNPVFATCAAGVPLPESRSVAWQAGQACLRDYALREVFTRDLVAAQGDGLLTLAGLESPLELAAGVPDPHREPNRGLVEAIEHSRAWTGQVLAVDGPEFAVTPDSCHAYVRELAIGLRATGLRAVVNLHVASPPDWAQDLAEGPLFAESGPRTPPEFLADRAVALLDSWIRLEHAPIRLDWHLGERDFTPGTAAPLERLARLALEGHRLTFVFDRPRRPIALAEGLDRQHAGVLLVVGLHLPTLLEQPGLRADPSRFVSKLGSLARLALSAGVQKRDFLRRHRPVLTRGFLLDRARLVVVPVGLEAVARVLTGKGLAGGDAGLDLARQIVQRLAEVLRQDGAGYRLDTCLDSAANGMLADASADCPPLDKVAGLTPWDDAATLKQQLKAAGALHALAGAGTAVLPLSTERTVTADEIADALRYAWRQTDVVRVAFVRIGATPRQLTAPWEATV